MATLLYLHGFLSSPGSHKAQTIARWLAATHPRIEYACPFLRPYPQEVAPMLQDLVERQLSKPVMLIGSSFGGFWATWLAERYDLRAVLVNPATEARLLDERHVDTPLKNYHNDETYLLTREHLQQLASYETARIALPDNYWLLVQSGDETLDYRLAVARYAGCKQTVEQGGNHAFEGFADHLPAILDFLLAGA